MPLRRAMLPTSDWLRAQLPPLPKLGPFVVIGRIVLPFAIYGALMLFVWLLFPERFQTTLARTLLVFGIGKFAAIGAGGEFLYWVFMIGTVDVLVGLFLVWNFDILYRVPGMGPILRLMEARGSLFLDEHAWVRKLAFIGIVLVVMVPFQGTGAVMGSIVGRLIGLGRWRVLAAIAVGGYLGVALILSTSRLIELLGSVHPLIAVAAAVVLVAAGLLAWQLWFRRRAAKPAAGAQEPPSP